MTGRRWTIVLLVAVVAAGSLFAGLAAADDDDDGGSDGIALSKLGTHRAGTNVFEQGAAEVAAYDPKTERLFVVNGATNVVDVLDISDPSLPTEVDELDISGFGSPNGVAVSDGVVAVASTAILASNADDPTQPGTVAFFTTGGTHLRTLTAGATPDMAAFTPNGDWLLIANEGEPNSYGLAGSVDPEGSISIIDMRNGVAAATLRTAGFTAFNGQLAALQQAGVRIFGPGATVAQDLEPEYVAISHNSRTAWVTIQEANAIAEVDIRSATVKAIRPLGTKDHSLAGNGLDASDQDGVGMIEQRTVRGMYMPDAIAALHKGEKTYLLTANEGDVREWAGIKGPGSTTEILRAGSIAPGLLDAPIGAGLARLNVTTVAGRAGGDTDGNGKIDVLQSFGARSFSVWSTDAKLIADSGDELEQLTKSAPGIVFNASNSNNTPDNRSDDKGPEPEEIELGKVSGTWYAFIALERPGGVAVYDLSRPKSPELVTYVNNRNFAGTLNAATYLTAGDLGPEGLVFISANDSPTREPLLAVANEISGTTTIYAIESLGGGDDEDEDDD